MVRAIAGVYCFPSLFSQLFVDTSLAKRLFSDEIFIQILSNSTNFTWSLHHDNEKFMHCIWNIGCELNFQAVTMDNLCLILVSHLTKKAGNLFMVDNFLVHLFCMIGYFWHFYDPTVIWYIFIDYQLFIEYQLEI